MTASPESESAQREAIRARHGVRELTFEEEGASLPKLPVGIYGFASAPTRADCPLFQAPRYRNFEVHKLADGSDLLLGFVAENTASRIASGDSLDLKLYPDIRDDSPRLVALTLSRISRFREHSMREDGGLELRYTG